MLHSRIISNPDHAGLDTERSYGAELLAASSEEKQLRTEFDKNGADPKRVSPLLRRNCKKTFGIACALTSFSPQWPK